MSEHEPRLHSPEHHADHGESKREQQEKLNELLEKAKHSKEKSPHEVERLAHQAKEKAVSGKEQTAGDIGKESSKQPALIIDKTVKHGAYKKTLSNVQRHLPKAQRSFSRLIHQETIEKVSEVSGKTIARPSGLLGGGVCALIGTSIVVWMSRHYGFRYNFFVFVALLLAGFFGGLLIELVVRSVKKPSRRS